MKKLIQLMMTWILLIQAVSCTSQKLLKDHDSNLALIENRIEKHSKKGRFHGGLLIAYEGEIAFESVYGYNTAGVANKKGDSFDLASIGKVFTGLIVAQLESEGRLSFSDNTGLYLPDYKGRATRQEVTVHHLLSHTSGIPDIFSFDFIQKVTKEQSISVDQYFKELGNAPYGISLFETMPLEFEPGSKFSYSNSGYLLLGLIIQQITGLDYSTHVYEEILDQAGMSETQILTSYGGGPSTLKDMFYFYKLLSKSELQVSKSFERIRESKSNMGKNKYYGYGLEIDESSGSNVVSHKGGGASSKAQFMLFPDTDYMVMIYANNNEEGYDAFNDLRRFIMKTLR